MATDLGALYERDFYAWTRHQARELRRLKALRLNGDLDLDHLAEEVRDLGSEQIFGVQSQAVRLIEHLLKLQFSAHVEPRRQWLISVNSARAEIEDRLTRSLQAPGGEAAEAVGAHTTKRGASARRPRRGRCGRGPSGRVPIPVG